MNLKHTTKVLRDKENSKTTSDASYHKNKQNMENKEREIKTIKVRI